MYVVFPNFYIEILEENLCSDKLDEREIFYINKYNSYIKGYNSTNGGSYSDIDCIRMAYNDYHKWLKIKEILK